MFTNYITPSKDTSSRSGLYANGLPGVTLNLLDDLTKDEQEDFEEFWEDIYNRSIINFVGEVQGRLADKFLIDLKLVSRETSKFESDDNSGTGIAGIKLEYVLPKYGVLHVLTIEVFSDSVQSDVDFTFYETNEDGRVLYTSEGNDLVEGINIIYIDQDFSVDKLFIGYDRSLITLRQTRNRYFDSGYYFSFSEIECTFPCYNNSEGKVTQIEGGGINVIYNATCSIRKFVEDNLNIFKDAFWYRIGLELIRERIFSDRFNRFTTMQAEDAEKKESTYAKECELKLNNAIRSLRLNEDPICFNCKSTVSAAYITP
jgi:hypothetical protein